MEFHEKLQQLRKHKRLTQEEVAEALFVSRTAVSKWESGRGYPNIDSLKAIAKLYSVTIDELLSGEQALDLAEEERRQREKQLCDRMFALLDVSVALLFLLPFFRWNESGTVLAVPLLQAGVGTAMKAAYAVTVIGMALWGAAVLLLSGWQSTQWLRWKNKGSLLVNAAGALLFTVSLQPYAAALLFAYLLIKGFLYIKKK